MGAVAMMFCIGCAAGNSMYYWGDYSNSLYNEKKNPGAESIAKHKAVLEKIIEESKQRKLRIPPGVCCELGYMYVAQNNTKKAIELFQMEEQTYPESTIFMDRLIMQAEKRTSSDDALKEKSIEKEKSIGENLK
jgi:hypothetical protein